MYRAMAAMLPLMLALATVARADDEAPAEKQAASDTGPKLGEAHVRKWKVGMIVSASGGNVGRMTGTTTIPIRWPEQELRLVTKDLSPGVTVAYKSYGTAKQMVVSFPRIADGNSAHALLIVEVTRHTLLPPDKTDGLSVPDAKSLPEEFKPYLSTSPLIESSHLRIKAFAKQLAAGQTAAWPHVRAIYDWVRKTIKYQEKKAGDEPVRCLEAIDRGTGDCNELTSTFIAICRASGIPARTVRIPHHCYPEFYLVDGKGNGHWYPAEASGTDDFGGIRTDTPIMQKGDNFTIKLPGAERKPYRFLPENLVGGSSRSVGRPALKLVCEPAE
jgi:hypothetical protein